MPDDAGLLVQTAALGFDELEQGGFESVFVRAALKSISGGGCCVSGTGDGAGGGCWRR